MKIKTKKQLNLPQLIEWAWDNNVKGEFFSIDKNEESGIYFATNNDFMMKNADFIRYNNTFTVEVEEEITEDTVIPKLTCYTAFGFKGTKYNISINDVKSHDPLAFYIMNDDLRMTLIWTHEKGLVD